MADKSAVEFLGRINGMFEEDPEGSYALLKFVNHTGREGTQIRVSEQQAIDLVKHIGAMWPEAVEDYQIGQSGEYHIQIGGGVGPGVWDNEKEVIAVNFADALGQAQGWAEECGGVVIGVYAS